CVVDDEVDSGEGLERADVAPLPADDASLEVIGLKLDHGHGGLHGVAGGHALEAGGEDVARAPLRLVLGLVLDLADEAGAVVAQRVLELLEQDLPGLPRAEAGHALELAHMLVLRLLE